MSSTKTTARMAGALYLASAIAAGVPIMYVPGAYIVDGNAAATAHNILAAELLFRTCIVSELLGAILLLFLVRTLYRLLNGIDRAQASLMVTLAALSVPISFVNVLNEIAALALVRGAVYLSEFAPAQRDAWAMLLLDLHGDGVSLANVFWGLWLFPFGVLVLKSNSFPRVLGVWLMLDCVALVCVSATALLLPAYIGTANLWAIIPELGELWMMLWLAIKGVGERKEGSLLF